MIQDGVVTVFILTVLLVAVPSEAQRRGQVNHHRNNHRNNNNNHRSHGVTYSELQKLGASCFPNDTCTANRKSDSLLTSYCHCGQICSRLGTCCVDSQFKNVPRDQHMMPEKCRLQHHKFSLRAFMIDRCPSRYNGEDAIKQLCLANGDQINDPLLLIPVTNVQHRVTYKNIFCATCNGEDSDNVVPWNLFVFVKTAQGYRKIRNSELQKLKFKDVDHWTIQGSHEDVRLQLEIPREISRSVYQCPKTEIISSCAPTWTDRLVAQKCASYMGIVISERKRYRNIHCALCNHKSLDSISCKVKTVVDPGDVEKIPFSFGLLLDINPTNGDLVGKRKLCRKNQIFHPTRMKCIRLRGCLTGFRLERGRCVRE